MRIIRRKKIKKFAVPANASNMNQGPGGGMAQQFQQPRQSSEEVTMRDLQLEQARLQRQQTQIQHQKSQLLMKNEMARRREVVQLQKLKKDETDSQIKNAIRAKKEENDKNDEARIRNAALYKPKPKLVQPVAMPKNKLS